MLYIILSIFFPVFAGIFLLAGKDMRNRKSLLLTVSLVLLVTTVLAILAITLMGGEMITLFNLTDRLPILFRVDELSVVFSVIVLTVSVCTGVFSFEYMKHEEKEKRYYGFFLIVLGVLLALCFSGNLITFYLFFELLTISSVPVWTLLY